MFPPSCFHPSITTLALVATASTLLATGCGGAGGDGKADDSLSAEGSSPGECSDGADNDEDGDYDCDDSDCFGAPDCADDDPGDTGSTGPVDADGDGFSAAEDCDDDDPTVPADDADCDGVATADDCNDTDPSSTIIAEDGDCDGVATADDCDDTDPAMPVGDADCDGFLTADDCNDADPTSTIIAEDGDCDGVATADDCDDSDPDRYPGAPEADVGLLEDPACDGGGGMLSLADFTFIAENPGDRAGISVSTAGDVDGDGLDDLFVGASGNDDGGGAAGKAYLVLGSSLAASPSTTIDLSNADFAFIGEDSVDFAGASVSTAGDVDGDGLDDLFVGAFANDAGGTNAGKAYLILGSSLAASTSTTIDLSNADFAFIGESANDSAGSSVSTAGDVDGDGLDDIIVGAPYNDAGTNDAGKAYLILGSSLAASTSTAISLSNADFALIGENTYDTAGSVSTAGDVDGDGLDDIIVGARYNADGGSRAGKAYLILGSSLAASTSTAIDLSSADFAFIGESANDYAGASVSTAGDVDGDGLDDIIVGAPYNDAGESNAGKAYVLLGSTLAVSSSTTIDLGNADFEFIGTDPNSWAGWSVSTAGDVDGDGLSEILVGQPRTYYGTSYGGAGIVLGSTLASSASPTINLSEADFQFTGVLEQHQAGYSVSSAGDVNGDGLDDILVGASYTNEGIPSAPDEVYLILSQL